jgi:dipeptidyl aminopeptidase/acylaminoacyl peptidase
MSFVAAMVVSLLIVATGAAQSYQRADQFLTWNLLRHVYHDQVAPTWYRDSSRFWYRVHQRGGFRFMTANPVTGSKAQLFDHPRLAAALSVAADTAIDPAKLPFQTVAFDSAGRNETVLRLRIGARGFRCDLTAYRCAKADTLPNLSRFVRSPDERWDAFASGYNLWIRPAAGGDSVRLTTDGDSERPYGVTPALPSQVRLKVTAPPAVSWSPDSRRIAITRYDLRNVARFHVISGTTARPVEYGYPYALPGDTAVTMSTLYLAGLSPGSAVPLQVDPQPTMSLYEFGAGPGSVARWTQDGSRVYFTHVNRGPKRVRLISADPATGEARVIVADSSSSYVTGNVDLLAGVFGAGSNWRVLRNGDVVWYSGRDGFGHYYRYGPDGALKNQITQGAWTVVRLLDVDETSGRLYFVGKGREAGRHPDYLHLYGVGLDGAGLALLSPEDANHEVRAVPAGRYFIDTYSTLNQPPITVVRAEGKPPAELERADVKDLLATGWKPGRVFTAKARDGITDLWGAIWLPSDFDSTKAYPVIDHIYPGPLISPVIKSFYPSREPFTYSGGGQVQALAELGFVVVALDALGNTGRSRSAATTWYGNMGDHGLPDHVTVIKQLGARMPFLDLDRVGIYGISGGGFASTAAILRYPDFYQVAVSMAGNHDNRTYYHGWGERFQGLLVRDTVAKTDNYAAAANKSYAGQLKGKLFLIHGDLDDNVHPAHTTALVDALIKANKTFDFLMVPDADHNLTPNPYLIRRTWDYFVEHLLRRQPPTDYLILPPSP